MSAYRAFGLLVWLASLLGMVTAVSTGYGAISIFTDRLAWEEAVVDFATEDFDGLFDPTDFVLGVNPAGMIDIELTGEAPNANGIRGPADLYHVNGTVFYRGEANRADFQGATRPPVFPAILFPEEVFAFGADWRGTTQNQVSGRLNMTIAGQTVHFDAELTYPGDGFLGVVSPAPFGRVDFSTDKESNEIFGVDDLSFSTRRPTVSKWSQLPEVGFGENIASDADWRELALPPALQTAPKQVVADDFRSDGRPIIGIRWWGSYFHTFDEPVFDPDTGEYESQVEEAFVASFHRDIPDPDGPGPAYSQPGELLGMYVIPVDRVRLMPTGMIGWDGHLIWQYEFELNDAMAAHLDADLAAPEAFYEVAGDIYWLSVFAENGYQYDGVGGFFDNTDPVLDEHFWGWHTSPDRFNDVPVAGDLQMSDEDWLFQDWLPLQPVHSDADMAFELLTQIPEPSALWYLLMGATMVGLRPVRRVFQLMRNP